MSKPSSSVYVEPCGDGTTSVIRYERRVLGTYSNPDEAWLAAQDMVGSDGIRQVYWLD